MKKAMAFYNVQYEHVTSKRKLSYLAIGKILRF